MKYRLLSFAVMLVTITGRYAIAEDVSGSFNVVCVGSDQVADPPLDKKSSIIKKQGNDPCIHDKNGLRFHLGDHINLLVEHAPGTSFDDAGEPNPADLVLYLDGRSLPGTYAKVMRSESEDETEEEDQVTWTVLRYELTRDLSTPEGRRNWTQIVTGPKFGKIMNVSTGLEHGEAVPTDAQISLVVLTGTRVAVALLVAVALAIVFMVLLLKTGALRDKEPAGPEIREPTQRAYSLSRVQALLWTLLTVYAFMFVYYLTGEYNATIPGSLVILMGISLGTLTTAAALDSAASSTKRQKAQAVQSRVSPEYYDLLNQRNEMKKQLHGIQQKWKDVKSEERQTPMAEQQSLQQALAGLNAKLRKDQRNYRLFTRALALKRSASVAPRSGFWSDLFGNEGGAGLHRVQFGLWTLVMMIVFVYQVFENVAMPDFDKTLLALMGISSGTYAGLKIPEDKGTDTASTDDSADDSADEEIDADVGDFQG